MASPTQVRVRPSADIARARDLLREILLRDENHPEDENGALVGTVSSALDEIQKRLDSLAGLQTMFEEFVKS